ncbi:S8 family serine peptidase [Aliidiomarina sanyensis]|uniref:Peptidase S8/S53 domain-containing protein n=1 Tax=Aliidiomarina sanyensis TaxID=1249555 RepID=A0A432WS72_9GAMM|nr:S8 family serine peptidase [Aliidiomarina sanyensis]RUO36615.1 hypothetical protein CWE11_02040 [Aliidiomarina sanyensis]
MRISLPDVSAMTATITRMSIVVGCLLVSNAWAQQIPNVPVVNPPERVIERTVERHVERAQRQAERLERTIERTDASGPQRALDNIVAVTERAIERSIGFSEHAILPERLAILDRQGIERFVEIEIEPGRRAIERQWVLLLSAEEFDALATEAPELWGFLSETAHLSGLDAILATFVVPRHLDNREGVQRLVPSALHDVLDRNHVYQANRASGPPASAFFADLQTAGLDWPTAAVCEKPVKIGVIDTGIEYQHEAFSRSVRENRFQRRPFVETSIAQPGHHGTAVSGLLIGESESFSGLVPNAHVFHAEVFYRQSEMHQGATVTHLIQALSWLHEAQVRVINLSLSGPPNRLLERTIDRLTEQGLILVAAVGNEGPHAEPLYPAAYQQVIAVTAVDRHGGIYRWANQGEHVEFAAYGVSVKTVRANSSWGYESGTSMAAPFVTAFAACHDQGTVEATRLHLRELALPLSEKDHSPVFGYGLLHPRTPNR